MTGAAMDEYERKLVAALQDNATLRSLVQQMVDGVADMREYPIGLPSIKAYDDLLALADAHGFKPTVET